MYHASLAPRPKLSCCMDGVGVIGLLMMAFSLVLSIMSNAKIAAKHPIEYSDFGWLSGFGGNS
jgi:hypothetical protein